MKTTISLAGLALVTASTLPAQGKLTIRSGTAWISPDRAAKNVTIEIANGKIRAVEGDGAAAVKDERGEQLRSYASAVLTSGFVDVHRAPLASGAIGERAESFTPELNAARAYAAWSQRWKKLRARGITSAVVAPGDENVGSGQGAFVKAALPARLANSSSYLKFSLTKNAISNTRKPTSLLGALELLRDGYKSLEEPGALSPAKRALASTIGGARRDRRPRAPRNPRRDRTRARVAAAGVPDSRRRGRRLHRRRRQGSHACHSEPAHFRLEPQEARARPHAREARCADRVLR